MISVNSELIQLKDVPTVAKTIEEINIKNLSTLIHNPKNKNIKVLRFNRMCSKSNILVELFDYLLDIEVIATTKDISELNKCEKTKNRILKDYSNFKLKTFRILSHNTEPVCLGKPAKNATN